MSAKEDDSLFLKLKQRPDLSSEEVISLVFDHFDLDRDKRWSWEEFERFVRCLFANKGAPYFLLKAHQEKIFDLIRDREQKCIPRQQFALFWNACVSKIIKPVTALVIVDVQNDFVDGTLAIRNCPARQEGAEVIPVINQMIESVPFDVVVFTYDWHPADHISFFENLSLCRRCLDITSKIKAEEAKVLDTVIFDGERKIEQKLWPCHCVQGSWGSELHKDLKVPPNSINVYKGLNSNIDSYSAFWDNNKLSETNLRQELLNRNVTDVYVCGLAYDVCVGSTALHAEEHGFRTILVDDASRGVDELGIQRMKDTLKKRGVFIVDSRMVRRMVAGEDRRPELGMKTIERFWTHEGNNRKELEENHTS